MAVNNLGYENVDVIQIPWVAGIPMLPEDRKSRYRLCSYLGDYTMGVQPYEFTGWADECITWKETCYLGTNLNPINPIHVWGPEATKSLVDNTTNSYAKFGIGRAKHAIFCNEEGNIACDGILLRMAEDEYLGYCLPYWAGVLQQGGYDAQFELLPEEVLIQIGGPTSLQVVEAACEENLHDIKFMQHRPSSILGHEVRILRAGMAGSLAYEVHCKRDDAPEIYTRIYEVGKQFGIKRQGMAAYNMVHWECGFPQAFCEWVPALPPDFLAFSDGEGGLGFSRSVGNDISQYFRNPFELGWDKAVRFDHDFVGREALERIATSNHRVTKTLIWNPDDVAEVYKAQFLPGEKFAVDIAMPDDASFTPAAHMHQDLVLKDGKTVGVSAGRMVSVNYSCMLSLGLIEPEFAEDGTELTVLWGNPGTRQQKIRVTVARFPYLDVTRNDVIDVTAIPAYKG